jgi:hypothetical protein
MMPSSYPPAIFVSVGYQLSMPQRAFVNHVDELIIHAGFAPVTIGRTTTALERPLEMIRDVIEMSSGTIVIAFARLEIGAATEYPGTDFARALAPRRLPTVWNEIEAAMTVQAQHPLLVLCERGLHYEGIIDPLIHLVIPFAFDASGTGQLSSRSQHAIVKWLRQVSSAADSSSLDPRKDTTHGNSDGNSEH